MRRIFGFLGRSMRFAVSQMPALLGRLVVHVAAPLRSLGIDSKQVGGIGSTAAKIDPRALENGKEHNDDLVTADFEDSTAPEGVVENEAGEIVLKPMAGDIRRLRGIVKYDGAPVSVEDMNKAIGDAAAESFRRSTS